MAKKPNLIFILNDHQVYYGHDRQTGAKPLRPRFEAFAAQGAEFSRAYCVAPMCGPARRSLLTGLYPHTHGQYFNENNPPYRNDVYLDLLAENGYQNYYYGKWHAGPGSAYDHHADGFSIGGYGNPYNTPEYAAYLKRKGLPRASHRIETVLAPAHYQKNRYFQKLKEGEEYRCEDYWCGERAVGITTTPKETHEAFFLASLACDKLEELSKSEQPFSLRVDFWGPHQPFFPTQEFADLYRPEDIEPYPSFSSTLEDKPDVLKAEASLPLGDGKHVGIPNPLPWSEWQKLLARCYAHTTMVDAAGGQILDKIKELKLDDNTLIVWSSDHGDAIACHGGHIDKNSHMAEEVMRIPLAINWKGNIAPGSRCDAYAFTCDIPVTLMDAAGLHFPERIDGRTLLDLLIAQRNVAPWRDSLMCESYGHGYGASKVGRMAVKGRMKYVCTEGDLDELYDLEQDPYQLKNLSNLPAYANVKQDMQALLRQKQAEFCDPVPLEQLLPKLS